MKRIVIRLLMVLAFAGLAAAQIPTAGNVYFGYSYYNTNLNNLSRGSLNGWQASAEARVLPFIGFVGDFGSTYGSQDFAVGLGCPAPQCGAGNVSVHVTETNILLGPRVSVSVGKIRPFAEALFGAGHISSNGFGSDTSFATAVGGGLDYKIIRPIAWRFQGDYLHTHLFSSTQNNVRISTGLVLRF